MKQKKASIFLKKLPKLLNKFYESKLKSSIKIKSKSKKIYNPVTNFDRAFERFIRTKISESFPNDGVMGEEFKNKISNNNFCWSIDPIDGTKAFVSGIPTWSNLVGLLNYNESIIGLANFPELKRFYISIDNNSYIYDNFKKKKIKTLNNTNLNKIKIISNFHGLLNYKKNKLQKRFTNSIIFHSFDALSYCLLAEGKLDAVIETNLKSYDVIPLIPIIKNAGGYISDWNNNNAEKGGNILATSNRKLHDKIIRLLKKL